MYIQSKGELQLLSEKLIFTNNISGYEIDGEDVRNFNRLFPYLTGTIHLNTLSKMIGIAEQELYANFCELEKNNIVSVNKKPFLRVSIISGSLESKKLKEIFHIPTLSEVISFTNLESISKDKTDIVVAFDNDGSEFFSHVHNHLRSVGVPWLKYSFSYSKIFMGPIFFPDGGPCYNCFQERLSRVEGEVQKNKSLGNLDSYFVPFIEKELLKFCRDNTPTLCFNTEIVLDAEELEIKKYQVFQLPDCIYCRGEVYE